MLIQAHSQEVRSNPLVLADISPDWCQAYTLFTWLLNMAYSRQMPRMAERKRKGSVLCLPTLWNTLVYYKIRTKKGMQRIMLEAESKGGLLQTSSTSNDSEPKSGSSETRLIKDIGFNIQESRKIQTSPRVLSTKNWLCISQVLILTLLFKCLLNSIHKGGNLVGFC